MKIVMYVFGGLLILIGGVWFFQGIGLLPGSFMSGQTKWAIYGGVAVICGAGLIFLARRRRAQTP
jgi:hypothetical protein